MNTIPITTQYAAILGLFMAVLSIRVPLKRAKLDVLWGDADAADLSTRIRVFGNLTEYLPMLLLLLLCNELTGTGAVWLHVAGVALIGARLIHAVSLHAETGNLLWRRTGRAIGAMSTWLILVGLSVALPVNSIIGISAS